MKKFICLLLCLTIFICSGCTSKTDDNNTTTTTEASTTEKNPENSSDIDNTTESTTSDSSTTESQTGSQVGEKDSTTTTKKNSGNSLLSDEEIEKLENSEAEVFFTDNPDNEYITAISEKYGVKKENLVALIKMNAEYPTITLFEFSGKKDKNGELVIRFNGEADSADTNSMFCLPNLYFVSYDNGENWVMEPDGEKIYDITGIECDDELLISRQITLDGKNNIRINGVPVILNMLKAVGDLLINIHSQHDGTLLLNKSSHLSFLDDFGFLTCSKSIGFLII